MIKKTTPITEITEKHPETVKILEGYGLQCLGCMAAHFESIEQGAAAHGVNIDKLMAELNASQSE